MRILTVGNMYPPHHLGGYELMWRSAVAHHRAAGHDVRVLTTDWHEHYVDASTPEDADVHRELRWYWHDHDFPRLGPLARRALESHNAGVLDRHLDEFRPHALRWWAPGRAAGPDRQAGPHRPRDRRTRPARRAATDLR
ncbi:MAG: hypothetical protein WKF49_03730 [Thermoleophilaceae bacterium]